MEITIHTTFSEIESQRFRELISEILFNNENILIMEQNTIINTADYGEHIYKLIPSKAIDITITTNHKECDKDYPYAVLFYINTEDYGAVDVYSSFVDVITEDLFKDLFERRKNNG